MTEQQAPPSGPGWPPPPAASGWPPPPPPSAPSAPAPPGPGVAPGWPPPTVPGAPTWTPSASWPQPKSRWSNPVVIIGLVAGGLVVVGLLVGLAALGARSSKPTGFSSSAPTTPAPDYPTVIAPPAPGYIALSDRAPNSGPLTADKLAQTNSNPAGERAGLRDAGFLDGYQRNWVNKLGTAGYYVRIYRLADANGAQYWLTLDLRGTGKYGPVVTNPSTGYASITSTKKDIAGNWAIVVFGVKGNYMVAARQFSRAPITSSAPMSRVVADQIARLPAS